LLSLLVLVVVLLLLLLLLLLQAPVLRGLPASSASTLPSTAAIFFLLAI